MHRRGTDGTEDELMSCMLSCSRAKQFAIDQSSPPSSASSASAVCVPVAVAPAVAAAVALVAEDVAADRPMRATIVVSRLHNWPARGFFETAQRLGVLAAELPAEQQIDWFHTQRIAACTAFG